jgi:hypothetical protein
VVSFVKRSRNYKGKKQSHKKKKIKTFGVKMDMLQIPSDALFSKPRDYHHMNAKIKVYPIIMHRCKSIYRSVATITRL